MADSINQNTIHFDYIDNLPHNFLSLLFDEKLKIMEYYIKQETLEDYFLRLTKRGENMHC